MLVLSRKKNEKILIGDDVEVVVVEIRVNKVRLGINAPKSVPVDREEVRKSKEEDRDRRQNKEVLGTELQDDARPEEGEVVLPPVRRQAECQDGEVSG